MLDVIFLSVLLSAIVAYVVSRRSFIQIRKKLSAMDSVIITRILTVTDKNSKPRITFMAGPSGPGAVFTDKNGKIRLTLEVENDQEPAISIRDANEKTRVCIKEHEAGYKLSFYDDGGNPVAYFGPKGEGATLEFAGPQGKLRTLLGVDKNGDAGLKIYDNSGNGMAMLVFNEATRNIVGPHLTLWDDKLVPRLGVKTYLGFPMIDLCDESGNPAAVLWVVGDVPVLTLYHPTEAPGLSKELLGLQEALRDAMDHQDSSKYAEVFAEMLARGKGDTKLEKTIVIMPGRPLRDLKPSST